MFFNRKMQQVLVEWKEKKQPKPLNIHGERQVGKTTLITEFGKGFDTFIQLNLELKEDADLFSGNLGAPECYQRILLTKNIRPGKSVLLFIDEIQNSPSAMQMLRYFYEKLPELYVISAGSLLEQALADNTFSFPVGTVEYRYLYPLSFVEYLEAARESQLLEYIGNDDIPEWALEHAYQTFHTYTMVGGMPEVVGEYLKKEEISATIPIYQSLLTSYQEDTAKYARNHPMRHIINHVIINAPLEVGNRITFARFGNSDYRSREVGEAFRSLERAMILHLRYPTTDYEIPLQKNLSQKPRLQYLDTGRLNYSAGLQLEFFKKPKDLNSIYQGKLTEHIVAQELIANNSFKSDIPLFWVREQRGSCAEVDFILQTKLGVLPVEVKSGKTGTLRSLHKFIDQSKVPVAIRLYAGKPTVEKLTTPAGTPFTLVSLPYFLANRLEESTEALINQR